MTEPTAKYWSEIQDLSPDWQHLRNNQTETLIHAWQARAVELQKTKVYVEFLLHLRRQWAIETGILERLYSLSDGATKTLIEQGLDAAFISSDDTDRSPQEVVAVIRDQFNAIEGLYQFISGSRKLSKSYICELHSVLTANQPHYDAIDTLGQRVIRELPRGKWKTLKNNVEGPDGFIFEFCPPEHVEAEMDRLLKMHAAHEQLNVPPEIGAAWLHHRFTLIHPFTDGNGRVARCLATLVLLKANWFPLVVTRAERAKYVNALRAADGGDLAPLIDLFSSLQTLSIRKAFSLSEDPLHESLTLRTTLAAVKTKLGKQRQDRTKQLLSACDTLQAQLDIKLKDIAREIHQAIETEGAGFNAFFNHAPREDARATYNSYQIVQCAKTLGYYANRQVFQAWSSLTITTTTRVEVLFAFHGMGQYPTGVLVCSAMVYTRPSADSEQALIGNINPVVDEPFYFTLNNSLDEVTAPFSKWVEMAMARGLDYWRKAIGA